MADRQRAPIVNRSLHQRVDALRSDEGISLVEVMVALLVFAVLSTGLAAGAMAIDRITADSRARQVATNLAAKELDDARAYDDPTQVQGETVVDSTTDPTHTYTVVRTVSSVGTTGADISCGSNVNFAFRRVTVTVDWGGRSASTPKVRSDTILAPTLPTTDAGTGAISIRVVGVDGQPRQGVTVSVTPVTDGKLLSSQPAATGSDGCSYANRLVPGVYEVDLSKSGYVDSRQNATYSNSTIAVAAGSTAPLPVEYDASTTYTTNYAKNFSGTAQLPSNLDTTFIPTTGSHPIAIKSPPQATQQLYPWPDGYSAVAGALVDPKTNATACAAMDPVQWSAGAVGTKSMAVGERATAVTTKTFGTSTTSSIPMGVVKVSSLGASYLTAKSVDSSAGGNPGCATSVTYTFSSVPLIGSTYIALPFGSWTIYQGTALGLLTTQVSATNVAVQTNQDSNGVTGGLFSNVVTLDPRQVAK